MNVNFKNKTLLITGGLGDFGKVIVKKFLKHNAKVIITTTKKDNFKNSKKLNIIHLNFNNKNSLALFEKKLKGIDKIDYLINNAGINILNEIYNIKKSDLENIDWSNFDSYHDSCEEIFQNKIICYAFLSIA